MGRNPERNITCVIAGSFRYKSLIDEYRYTFERWGVRVLQPSAGEPRTGKLYIPNGETTRHYGDEQQPFWPLENEVGKSIREIEGEFLSAIARASLLYVVTVDHHIGLSASMEIGFALGSGTPIFTNELPRLDAWPSTEATLATELQVMGVSEAVKAVGGQMDLGLWIPASHKA